MSTFYYIPRPELRISNTQLNCSDASFERLMKKEKITPQMERIMQQLKRYRLLTARMLSIILKMNDRISLFDSLDKLVTYGLIIKQRYSGEVENETVRSEIFYSLSEHPPKGALPEEEGYRLNFHWNKDIPSVECLRILAFNQFHICMKEAIPNKSLQSWVDYKIGDILADGRYYLRSPLYYMGYSHLIVLSVRDFSEHNNSAIQKIKQITLHYRRYPDKGKEPWFILLCENEAQSANLNRRLAAEEDCKSVPVYYLLDTDLSYGNNPLKDLQIFRFRGDENKIDSESYSIQDWY